MTAAGRVTPSARVALSVAGAAALLLPPTTGSARAATRPTVETSMAEAGWTPAEIAAAVRGEVVTGIVESRMVGPNDTAEVAVLGVVRVDVPRQAFVDAIEQADVFRGPSHLETGLIHNPPQASDFAAVALPPHDIRDLRDCRPGRCALRLTGPGLTELRSRIDWGSADAADQVNRLAREALLDVATSYMKAGLAAFKPFEDSPVAVNVDEQFRQLLQDTPTLVVEYPELAAYLRDYPATTLAVSKETFYWSLDDLGVKPTLTMTQAVAYLPEGTEDVVVAWKQLYASHFFNGGLSVTTYANDGGASYVVQLDRVRADGLGGAFGRIKRGKMAGAMEGEAKAFLRETKAKLLAQRAKTP